MAVWEAKIQRKFPVAIGSSLYYDKWVPLVCRTRRPPAHHGLREGCRCGLLESPWRRDIGSLTVACRSHPAIKAPHAASPCPRPTASIRSSPAPETQPRARRLGFPMFLFFLRN